MLTCYDEFEYVREAMRGGASDYVLKAGMNETGLLDAVKRLEYDKKRGEGPKQDQEPKTEQDASAANGGIFHRRGGAV